MLSGADNPYDEPIKSSDKEAQNMGETVQEPAGRYEPKSIPQVYLSA
jgi:hypothetical protein